MSGDFDCCAAARLDQVLDREQVADRLGVLPATVTRYRQRDDTFPQPVRVFAGTCPVWFLHDVDRWVASRPGRGVGGGRPRKTEAGA